MTIKNNAHVKFILYVCIIFLKLKTKYETIRNVIKNEKESTPDTV